MRKRQRKKNLKKSLEASEEILGSMIEILGIAPDSWLRPLPDVIYFCGTPLYRKFRFCESEDDMRATYGDEKISFGDVKKTNE